MKAKVILRGAKTYNLGGMRWIKDVPKIVHGEDKVKEFKENGYFYVVMLKSKSDKKKKSSKKAGSPAPEPPQEPKPKPASKKASKKAGGRKKTKKRLRK